jgi:hypothetical protein
MACSEDCLAPGFAALPDGSVGVVRCSAVVLWVWHGR